MNTYNYKKLQNGSDIRGIAMEGIPGETPNLTVIEAAKLAKGFLLWLCDKVETNPADLTIAVGSDPRLTGPELKNALLCGLTSYNVRTLDCGLASTPAMFMSTVFPEFECDGAIMITASHLPFNRNGFKFFDEDGGLDKSDIAQIIEFAEDDEALKSLDYFVQTVSVPEQTDLMDVYCEHLRNIIIEGVDHPTSPKKPLQGMKIIVDAGNGSGGFYADKILKPLGADITGSQFLEPDGHFPNHAPNPENKEAMASISKAVTENKADLGLIFDTDVDRSAAVDNRGREIARNGIVAMAAALLAEDFPGTTIVTDSITSDQLTVFLEKKLKLKHLRYKRGYKNVINKAIELNEQGIDSQLAIETSGHAALKENYFLDDGAYLATKIVIKAAKLFEKGLAIDTVLADLEEPKESVEVRIPITCEDFAPLGDKILSELAEWASKNDEFTLADPNYEGVRLISEQEEGWCLLRKSLHDPIMPLNIESNAEKGCAKTAKKLYSFLNKYEGLDLTPLEKII